jgi:hypothetical protein
MLLEQLHGNAGREDLPARSDCHADHNARGDTLGHADRDAYGYAN